MTNQTTLPSKEELQNMSSDEADLLIQNLTNQSPSSYIDIGSQYLSTLQITKELNPEINEDTFFYTTNLRFLGIVEVTNGNLSHKKLYTDLIADAYPFIEEARGYGGNDPAFEFGKLTITAIGRETLNAFKEL